jgi:hypothetical protein
MIYDEIMDFNFNFNLIFEDCEFESNETLIIKNID